MRVADQRNSFIRPSHTAEVFPQFEKSNLQFTVSFLGAEKSRAEVGICMESICMESK
jgi:hypothetical protein